MSAEALTRLKSVLDRVDNDYMRQFIHALAIASALSLVVHVAFVHGGTPGTSYVGLAADHSSTPHHSDSDEESKHSAPHYVWVPSGSSSALVPWCHAAESGDLGIDRAVQLSVSAAVADHKTPSNSRLALSLTCAWRI